MKISAAASAAHPLRAIVYALIGFTCWTVSDSINKLILGMDVPNYQMMALNGFSGFVIIACVALARGDGTKLKPKNLRGLFAYGLLLPINYCIILVALRFLPLASFYAISFGAPLCVAILSRFFLREKMGIPKIAATIIGFAGVLIAINPAHAMDDHNAAIGVGASLAAMFIFSVQQLWMRHLSRNEAQECVALYPRLVTVSAGLIGIFILGYHPMPIKAVLYLVTTGCVGGIGWLLMAHAYKNASAVTVAPFHYSQIISGAAFGYILWGDIPHWNVILGVAIIMATGIYLILHSRKAALLREVEI